MALLTIKDLNVNYGSKKILSNISLNFEAGKLYGVLGPNGAGKSTLFKAITNLINIESGRVFIKDKDVISYNIQELAQRVSSMSQNLSMEFPYTVSEIVSMGRYPYSSGYLNEEDKLIIDAALKESELEDIKDKKVNKLSGGEKQRVVFSKTLCQDTEIVLIDEGFSNMDIYYQIKFIKLLKERIVKENKLIIFIMHDLAMAKKYCDEILMLKEGTIHSFGKSEDVLTDTALLDVFRVQGKFSNYSLEFM